MKAVATLDAPSDFHLDAIKVARYRRMRLPNTDHQSMESKPLLEHLCDPVRHPLNEPVPFLGHHLPNRRINKRIVDRTPRYPPSVALEVPVDIHVHLKALPQLFLLGEEPVVSVETHISQSQYVFGHSLLLTLASLSRARASEHKRRVKTVTPGKGLGFG